MQRVGAVGETLGQFGARALVEHAPCLGLILGFRGRDLLVDGAQSPCCRGGERALRDGVAVNRVDHLALRGLERGAALVDRRQPPHRQVMKLRLQLRDLSEGLCALFHFSYPEMSQAARPVMNSPSSDSMVM